MRKTLTATRPPLPIFKYSKILNKIFKTIIEEKTLTATLSPLHLANQTSPYLGDTYSHQASMAMISMISAEIYD